MANEISPDQLLVQLRAMAARAQGLQSPAAEIQDKGGFSDLLNKAVSAVNSNQQQAGKLAEAFQKGDPNVQMSEVMLSLQKANVSFQAMVEVRNRLVSAYQEIMNMQI